MAAELYSCLDPRGHTPAIVKTPLSAPRPSSLDYKNVLMVMHEKYPYIMPLIREEVARRVPGVNIVWWDSSKNGRLETKPIPWDPKPDAAMIGLGF